MGAVQEMVFDFDRNKLKNKTEVLRCRNNFWVKMEPRKTVVVKPSHHLQVVSCSDK